MPLFIFFLYIGNFFKLDKLLDIFLVIMLQYI